MEQKAEFKALSDETFIALMTLKTAKMDYEGSLKLKGRFVTGYPYPIPYTEREFRQKKILAEYTYNRSLALFRVLWRARRRLQAVIVAE